MSLTILLGLLEVGRTGRRGQGVAEPRGRATARPRDLTPSSVRSPCPTEHPNTTNAARLSLRFRPAVSLRCRHVLGIAPSLFSRTGDELARRDQSGDCLATCL